MTDDLRGKAGDAGSYTFESKAPSALSQAEFEAAMKIVTAGNAVDTDSARRELPKASGLVLACKGPEIAGIGTIKRARPKYARTIQERSGISFEPDLLELGYVAVAEAHKGQHLSRRIVEKLLAGCDGDLFATTGSDRMKRTLTHANFVRSGHEWKGKRAMLSLWVLRRKPS
ncbi:MAG: hypothetical protein JSR60_07650 [Proteobacteria bacterium]|nr:hypothetical protein [Pseudomonadota bacterium]